ncbi:MAG: hypothetical protein RIE77_12735 [Phycisphaerales bacterium]|jgi:hypothetical protein
MTNRIPIAMAAATLLGLAALAHGQPARNGVNIVVEDTTLELGESTTIRLEAYFDPALYGMASVATSFFSSEGRVGLSDPRLVSPMDGAGTAAGVPVADGFDGIRGGQLHGVGGIYGDDSNPIAFWEVTYTAPVAGSEPLFIDFSTRTTGFNVYLRPGSPLSESRLDDFAEGTARIQIVPAPAGALVLAGLMIPAARRRRSR